MMGDQFISGDLKLPRYRYIGSAISLASATALASFLLVMSLGSAAPQFYLAALSAFAAGLGLFAVFRALLASNESEQRIDGIARAQDALASAASRSARDIAALREEMRHSQPDLGNAPAQAPVSGRAEPSRNVAPGDLVPPRYARARSAGNDIPLAADIRYSESLVLELLKSAISNDNLDLFVQPVVRLPQRKISFYELYIRIQARPGAFLSAAQYIGLANREELGPVIDGRLLLKCLDILRLPHYRDSGVSFFINITPKTLRSRAFIAHLVTFLGHNRELASRLILELSMEDVKKMDERLEPVLHELARAGCRFSADNAELTAATPALLARYHIGTLKIPVSSLVPLARDVAGIRRVIRIKRQLEAAGVSLIVDHIETEEELREVLDLDIDYGQGYLFGRPDRSVTWLKVKNAV